MYNLVILEKETLQDFISKGLRQSAKRLSREERLAALS